MQIFLKVAAVQVKIVISLKDEFMQQKIGKLIGAAECGITGENPVQVKPVLGTQLGHARPKGRNIHGMHDDETAVDVFRFQFFAQLQGRSNPRIFTAVYTGGDEHGRAVIFPVDKRCRDGIQGTRNINEST